MVQAIPMTARPYRGRILLLGVLITAGTLVLLIKETTGKLFAQKAALTIAHRLSTIVGADRALVLHDGALVEEGTHDTLIALPGGRYAALYGAQVLGVLV